MTALFRLYSGRQASLWWFAVLLVAVPGAGAGQEVGAALVVVDVNTDREVDDLSVRYHQVRAHTEDDEWFRDELKFVKGDDQFDLELATSRRLGSGQELRLAVVVPQDRPTWGPNNPDVDLFGDCVIVAVGRRETVVVVNLPNQDGDNFSVSDEEEINERREVQAEIDDHLDEAFEDTCRRAPRAGLGRDFDAGQDVRAKVSKFDVAGWRVPDELPMEQLFDGPASYTDDRFIVVDVEGLREEAYAARAALAAEPACAVVSGDLIACRASILRRGVGRFVGMDGGIVWLDEKRTAFGAAYRRPRDGPFALLVARLLDWRPFDTPTGLNAGSLVFSYEYRGLNFRLASDRGSNGGGELRSWSREFQDSEWMERVRVRGDRLDPFEPVLAVTSGGALAVAFRNPRPTLIDAGDSDGPLAVDRACGDLLPFGTEDCDAFYEDLLSWANGEAGSVEVTPTFGRSSELVPRVSEDGRGIEIDPERIRWLQFRLNVSTRDDGPFEPANGWTIALAAAGGVRESGLRLGRGGTIDSYQLARELEGAPEPVTLVARTDSDRFFGYLPARVEVTRDEIRGPGDIVREAVVKPEEVEVTSDMLRRFAPALEIERADGSVVRLIGELDGLDRVPHQLRVEGSYADARRLTVNVSTIFSMRPIGLGAQRPPLTGRKLLRSAVDALTKSGGAARCQALRSAFAASSNGVDLYVSERQDVALRWHDGSRYRVSIPRTSDSSSGFRFAPGVQPGVLEIWADGKWRPFEDRDACEAPLPSGLGTAYFLVLAEDFRQSGGTVAGSDCNELLSELGRCSDGGVAGDRSEDDFAGFRAHWSRHADDLWKVLQDDFDRVELIAVSGNPEGGATFERMGGPVRLGRDAGRRAMAEFRRLYEAIPTDMMVQSHRNPLADPSPAALRGTFLEWRAEDDGDPFGALFILSDPRGEAGTRVVTRHRVARPAIVTGYLGANENLPALVRRVLLTEARDR